MSPFPPLSISERVQETVHHLAFLRAQAKYFKNRTHAIENALRSPNYRQIIREYSNSSIHNRPVHVVVIPHEGEEGTTFAPGKWNIYYEAGQSLIETPGAQAVSYFHVAAGEPPWQWHSRLINYIHDVGATHVIGHIEADPGQGGPKGKPGWTWDVLWAALSRTWDGVLLGVMFDSSFEWLAAQSRLLARISSNFMLVDICIPMDGKMVRGRPEVGPVNMPVSRESLALVDDRITGIVPSHDVSFVGTMYPYRVDLIAKLRSLGVSVSVNPHRSEFTEDFKSSRTNQPSWVDYMAALASSRMTLNFSQSSAGRFIQLKTRVLEATLAGTMLLTDDVDRTSRFFVPNEEYGYFKNIDAAPAVIEKFLADPERVASIAARGQAKARSFVHTAFWEAINNGLRRRDLPLIFP